MPYSYTLSTVIPASPAEIYRAWLDSILHSEMTGGEANMSDEVGVDVSAWDGYITGRNLELVADERIVQSWRTAEFDEAFEDSIVTILLQETEDGTLLTLEHSNVPDDQKSYEEGGWQSNYFEPMIAYFAGLRGQALTEPEAAASPDSAANDDGAESATSAPAPAAKSAPGTSRRRKASAGSQRGATSAARKAKPPAARKKKATARAAKVRKKASGAPAKRAAGKSSAKATAKSSAKTSARRGAAKKAVRAGASRRKSARGRRR
jgi:uncharacterized protein YndB with AHSA1/START domain